MLHVCMKIKMLLVQHKIYNLGLNWDGDKFEKKKKTKQNISSLQFLVQEREKVEEE